MAGNPYDQVAYPTYARVETHPDRLAAAALLFGMSPKKVTRCRVLEIGCGDGGNLIPMAYGLPESRFVGVDLAEAPIAAARRAASELELDNVVLTVADLCQIRDEWGEFDYIVAHGLYSWIPADVRDRLLGVCRERLARDGVALVSYNTWPGRCIRNMLRDMLIYHTRDMADPGARLEQARSFLEALREQPGSWTERLAPELDLLLSRDTGSLFHDDLAEINQPVWFHEFAAHAARHGLQYLCEAATPGQGIGVAGNRIERQQELDFHIGRSFRQTLLCGEESILDFEPDDGAIQQFLFSAHPLEDSPGIASALGEVYPLPVPFEELVPYAGGEAAAREVLWGLLKARQVNLHVHDFPCQEEVSMRPVASRLARYQAANFLPVTNACHIVVDMDDSSLELLPLLDGSRTQEELAASLPELAGEIPAILEWMAATALLEG